MNRQSLVVFLIGGLIAAGLAAVFLSSTWNNHVTLTGSIKDVRTLETDENSTFLVVDFQIANPSNTRFQVREVAVRVVDPNGQEIAGDPIADVDVQRVFAQQAEIMAQRRRPNPVSEEVTPVVPLNRGGTVTEVPAPPRPRAPLPTPHLLGPVRGKSLVARQVIAPHETFTGMTAVQFPAPESQLQQRQAVILRLEDVDGTVVSLRFPPASR